MTRPEVRKVFEEIFGFVATPEKEKDEAKFAAQLIVCGSELPPGRGKPNPDIFLKALDKLNAIQEKLGKSKIQPSECFVYEDSPAGVNAGLAAGARVVHVPDMNLPEKFLYKAHYTLPSLQDFVDLADCHFESGIFGQLGHGIDGEKDKGA